MSSRRYGSLHKTVRKRWRLKVQAGGVHCARCGELIEPGTPWDLGHVDGGRPGQYSGAEHRSCNRGQPAKEAWAARKREAAKAEPGPAKPLEIIWSRHWSGGYNIACEDCRALGGPCEVARRMAPDEVLPAGGWVVAP